MQTAVFVAVFLAAGAMATLLVLGAGFRRRIARMWARVGQGPSGTDQGERLPPLVAAYARRAGGRVGAGHLAVDLVQKADLRLKRGGLFTSFTACQRVAVGRPGFVWHARRRVGPLTLLRVVDCLVEGEGLLEARILGALTVARANGVETTLAEAYRYLAELPWLPDAILGNPDLSWRMVSDREAEVKLDTRVGTARVCFQFDEAGDIVSMQARDRPAQDAKGRPVRYDWRGRFGEYRDFGNRRLPAYGEVGYVYPDGFEVYFRSRLTGCSDAGR
jgi:hypothetical protein